MDVQRADHPLHSRGAVTIGMTISLALAAAGVQLSQVGDGIYAAQGGTPRGLSMADTPVSCVSAQDSPGAPRVITAQGLPLGGTLARPKALYGSSLRFMPAPQGGFTPSLGTAAGEAVGGEGIVHPAVNYRLACQAQRGPAGHHPGQVLDLPDSRQIRARDVDEHCAGVDRG